MNFNPFQPGHLEWTPASPQQPVTTKFLTRFMSGSLPNCTDIYSLEPEEEYHLLDDGQLHHPGYGHTLLYCVENSVNRTGHVTTFVLKCEEQLEQMTARTEDGCVQNNRSYQVVFTVLGIVSLLFLIITFIVYVSIPDLFNLHGKIVVSNVTSIFLVTSYILIVYNVTLTSSALCVIIGYFGYFVSISMFGWMTVICLDLCWTFCRSIRPGGDSEISKFISFSVGAWGLAAFLTALVFSADNLLPEGSDLKPNVGVGACFIEAEGNKRMVYFHIPILVLMVINMILYLVTVCNLSKHSKQTSAVRESRR